MDAAGEGQLMGDVLVANRCIHAAQQTHANEAMEHPGLIDGNGSLFETLNTMLVRNWPKNKQEWLEVPNRPRPPKVHIGTVVSGPILYNDHDRLLEALNHPQVRPHNPLGGDMELCRIVDAATRCGKLWLAAKGVCDFGSIKPRTNAGRALANATAADFADWLLGEHVMSQYLAGAQSTTKPPSTLRKASGYAPLFYDLGPFAEFANREPRISDSWTDIPRDHPPVVCVVTTAPSEYDAVLARLESAEGCDSVLQVVCEGVPMLVGKLGNYQVTLLQTQMGADATKEALLQVVPSLRSIVLVMAVGFGYGLDPAPADMPIGGQMIGDVMVSETCFDLSTYKATDSSIEPHANCTHLESSVAIALSKPVRDAWIRKIRNWGDRPRAPRVHFGTYVSLPVDIDNKATALRFAKAAKHFKPIGGDKELFQIARAVNNVGHATKAWLAIKSISDFCGLPECTKEGQSLAAITAADFACYVMSIPGLLNRLFPKSIRQEETQAFSIIRQEEHATNTTGQQGEPAIRTNLQMVRDIEAHIEAMKQLIEKNLDELEQFSIPRVSNAYSDAVDEISCIENFDPKALLLRVNEVRVLKTKQYHNALEEFCKLVTETRTRCAVALMSIEDREHATNQFGPLLKLLAKFAIRPHYSPGKHTLKQLRGLSPYAWLFMGCLPDRTNIIGKRTLRFWGTKRAPSEMRQEDVALMLSKLKPKCVLLIADNTTQAYGALERRIPRGTFVITWNGVVNTQEATEFLERFLPGCLCDAMHSDLHTVEYAYIRATLLCCVAGEPPKINLLPCSQKVQKRLDSTIPVKVNIRLQYPHDLLKNQKSSTIEKIKAIVKSGSNYHEQVYENEVKITIRELVYGPDLVQLTNLLHDLEFFGGKVNYFPTKGSFVYDCIVPDLSWFSQWVRDVATDLESRDPPPFRIVNVALVGLIVETSALQHLKRELMYASDIDDMITSELYEERLFARLVQSDLTFGAIRALGREKRNGNTFKRIREVSLSKWSSESEFVHIYAGHEVMRSIRENMQSLAMWIDTDAELKQYGDRAMPLTAWPLPKVTLEKPRVKNRISESFPTSFALKFKQFRTERYLVSQVPSIGKSATIVFRPRTSRCGGIFLENGIINIDQWEFGVGQPNFITNALLTTQDWLWGARNEADLRNELHTFDQFDKSHPKILRKCPQGVADARIQEAVAVASDCARRAACKEFGRIPVKDMKVEVNMNGNELHVSIKKSMIGDGTMRIQDCRIWRLIHAYCDENEQLIADLPEKDLSEKDLSPDVMRWLVVLLALRMYRTTQEPKLNDNRIRHLSMFFPIIRAVIDIFACDVMPNVYLPSRGQTEPEEMIVRSVESESKKWLVAIDPIAAATIPSVEEIYRLSRPTRQSYEGQSIGTFCGAPGTSSAASAACIVSLQGPYIKQTSTCPEVDNQENENTNETMDNGITFACLDGTKLCISVNGFVAYEMTRTVPPPNEAPGSPQRRECSALWIDSHSGDGHNELPSVVDSDNLSYSDKGASSKDFVVA